MSKELKILAPADIKKTLAALKETSPEKIVDVLNSIQLPPKAHSAISLLEMLKRNFKTEDVILKKKDRNGERDIMIRWDGEVIKKNGNIFTTHCEMMLTMEESWGVYKYSFRHGEMNIRIEHPTSPDHFYIGHLLMKPDGTFDKTEIKNEIDKGVYRTVVEAYNDAWVGHIGTKWRPMIMRTIDKHAKLQAADIKTRKERKIKTVDRIINSIVL